jgi:hypothetical protein
METITAKQELLQRSSCTPKHGASNYFEALNFSAGRELTPKETFK